MKVNIVSQSMECPATNPFPQDRGVYSAEFKGDIAHPYTTFWWNPFDPGKWFPVMTFTKIKREKTDMPKRFVSWRFLGQQGYIGWKPWGMDEQNPASGIYDNYRRLLAPEDVYPGSQALMFSIRNPMTVLAPIAACVLCAWALLSAFR